VNSPVSPARGRWYNGRVGGAVALHNRRVPQVLRKSSLPVVVAVLVVAGCKPPMTDFTSAEYKFKAKFPGSPKAEEQTVMGIKMKMFGVETRNGASVVGVSDMPIPANEPDAAVQARLDGARDGAIKNAGGTLASSSPVTLAGKYPGREFTASVTNPTKGLVRARVYLVGKRMYQVMVMGTESYANSAASTEFLNSFQVIE
jgi:hypothetical protein